jgi:tRNA 5-methylaminomethyl-2-thiouridine biosynthesis bifunctional protein
MNTHPITASALAWTDEGEPYSAQYHDADHPRSGAFVQARHVFLGGNGLPGRWQDRPRFVILETGFGLGNNFLATWQAWRDDPARCERLVYISVEQHPFSAGDMQRAHAPSPVPDLVSALIEAWPVHTHNLHTLDFESGRVQLLLALGDAQAWLPELVADVDAFYLDGHDPACNPRMWEPRIYKALARLATPGATLATRTAAIDVREGLTAAGFDVQEATGAGGKRDISLARYAPRFLPRRPPSRTAKRTVKLHALIIGAGLAGCATAEALAQEGWRTTVYDRLATPAGATSGNPAGLFHGIVNAQDGIHARFNRAAALLGEQYIAAALHDGAVRGAISGLLRLDAAPASELHAVISQLGLPAAYVRAVDADEASALSGLPLRSAAWFYPGGGWVDPAALARSWLARAAPFATFRGGIEVANLKQNGQHWQLLDARGHVIDEAETVVLANAAEALRLLDEPAWPITSVRGQISHFNRTLAPHLVLPRMPVAGAGYVMPEVAGLALFGATSQPGDGDARVREADHAANLEVLRGLLGSEPSAEAMAGLRGRVGWRMVAQDRLPVIGAVPDIHRLQGRIDQPRFVPRVPGLFVFTALGSRGISWAPLGARTLASWITGAPAPLEASLMDAIDPARFISREKRRPAIAAAADTREDG